MRLKHFIRFTIHYATKLISSMLRRLFLIFLPSLLTTSVSYANQASWNCEQNKDSKEWVCVGDTKPGAKSSEAVPPVKPESVKASQPALIEPVEKIPAIKTQPVQITKPISPESTERVQPVITKPVPVTKPVIPAPVESNEPVISESVRAAPPVTAKSVENIQPTKAVPVQSNQPLATEPVKTTQPTLPAPQKPALDTSKLSQKEANHPGWNCDANKEDKNWNCQLVGADPGGRAQLVATDKPLIRLLEPAFDHQQEQTFSTLISQLKYDPWGNCSAETGTERDFVPEANLRDVSPMDVDSNYAEVFDNEIISYSGNVKLARADQHASANTANYDSVSQVLDLHGNVYYREDELALHSDTATLKLASDQSTLRDVQFISPTAPLRGQAKAVYRDSKTLSRYKNVAYTRCRPGNQDWIAHASELKLNKITGRGSAKNTWIEFKGTPVFYSPYLSFPIDNRRLSGFLAPVFGTTKNAGFRLSAPYYWNIAPNYDATLSLGYLAKRGALLAGNFRYLTEQSKGITSAEFLPNDNVTNKSRYQASFRNTTQFTSKINSNLDLNYVSDKTYFAELGNALSFPNFSFLRSDADISYVDQGISFVSRLENYQAINATIPDASLPYRKLPQINLNLDHAFSSIPLYTAFENEYVYYQHNDLVNAQRINTKPSISLPLQTASAFFTPKVSLQHTQYLLSDGSPGTPDSISRTLPIFSADSGLFFERDIDIAKNSYLHTLEPRLFYLYIPYKNQSNIPLFDSSQYDFSFNSLFRENSFSGTDRVQNANQVTTALTSRLIDSKSGRETLKLSVGEIFYFHDRNVTLPFNPIQTGNLIVGQSGSSVETSNFSNLVTELSSELTDHISIGSGLQWNPNSNDIERGQAVLHYKNQPDEVVNVGYLYRKNPRIPDRLNDVIQSDVSFRWPIYDNWYVLGRWQYSLLYNTTQEGFLGLEKENCCWRFRVIGRHYINNINNIDNNNVAFNSNQVVEGTSQNGIFFQIELKGLTGLGQNLDTFFEQNIYGYRKPQK